VDPGEQKAISDIAKYGCHVMNVMEHEDLAPFSYSIGIEQSSQAPELIVIGLKHPIAHSAINEYNARVRAGTRYNPGDLASGFIEGFDCRFQSVDPSHYREYLGWNLWFYKGPEFRVLQLVYPTTSGTWPNEPGASEWFNNWQVMLDKPASSIAS